MYSQAQYFGRENGSDPVTLSFDVVEVHSYGRIVSLMRDEYQNLTVAAFLKTGTREDVADMAHRADRYPYKILDERKGLRIGHLGFGAQ